jgi:hypothetical protein
VADGISKLLMYIACHYTGPEEAKDLEREATSRSGQDLDGERKKAIREEEQRAQQLDEAFRAGLNRALEANQAGGDAILLDDRDPQENQIADAMVHFLVGPGIATARTRETTPQHYTYTIWVDWDQLHAIARRAEVDLRQALKQAR